MSWVKAKDDELLRAEAVAGIPDRVTAQIAEVEVHVLSLYLHLPSWIKKIVAGAY